MMNPRQHSISQTLARKRQFGTIEPMLRSIKQLLILASNSKKVWMIPLVLFLIIAALLIISAQLSPLPVFLYPIL